MGTFRSESAEILRIILDAVVVLIVSVFKLILMFGTFRLIYLPWTELKSSEPVECVYSANAWSMNNLSCFDLSILSVVELMGYFGPDLSVGLIFWVWRNSKFCFDLGAASGFESLVTCLSIAYLWVKKKGAIYFFGRQKNSVTIWFSICWNVWSGLSKCNYLLFYAL